MKDPVIELISEYVHTPTPFSTEAYQTSRLCLTDALGCAILSLRFSACTKLLGPIVPDTTVPQGTRVIGTPFILDPVTAAFDLGLMIRWLDFNDTWLAAEWGHPSDNIGGLLAIADHLSRTKPPLTVRILLEAMIKAYEIQGNLALLNSFNRVGLDHVILVKVATAAVVTKLLGGDRQQIEDALSQAWIDLGPLRTYRHAPNTGSRKSWAAGDATSRGVFLALMTMRGEKGYSTPLSAKQWGFYDAIFRGQPFQFQRPFESYVVENVLFKVSFPAEFHAQTAVECAFKLHPIIGERLNDIATILIETHRSAIRIIDKKGKLNNPADRDHCLQYMVAVALLKGTLSADDYEDHASGDARIDMLRDKMQIIEQPSYTTDYLDPEKRSIANAITIVFQDGTKTDRIAIEYPLGHRKRRAEAIPLLFDKFENNLRGHYSEKQTEKLCELFQDHERLCGLPVHVLVDAFALETKK